MHLWVDILGRSADRHNPSPPPTSPRWPWAAEVFERSVPCNFEDATDERQDDPEIPEPGVDERDYAEEHRHEARDSIREPGMEAMAFYASIHRHRPEHWGIYVNDVFFWGVSRGGIVSTERHVERHRRGYASCRRSP